MADRGHTGHAYRQLRDWVLATFDDCLRCYLPVDKTLPGTHPWGPTLDLVLPYARGGQLTRENSRLSHNRCNCGYRDGRRLRPLPTQRGRYAPSRAW
jgi:hypothetical protein